MMSGFPHMAGDCIIFIGYRGQEAQSAYGLQYHKTYRKEG